MHWEEDKSSYLRYLIADIQTTLKESGAEDVFVKRHSECFVNVDKINCDAYEYKKNNPTAVRMYRGEYMAQYSWPIFYLYLFFSHYNEKTRQNISIKMIVRLVSRWRRVDVKKIEY